MSSSSSPKLPQSAFGMAVPQAQAQQGGTVAKAESDHRESGDNPLTPISRKEVTYQEEPSLLPETKKEEESSNASSELLILDKEVAHMDLTRIGPVCRKVLNKIMASNLPSVRSR